MEIYIDESGSINNHNKNNPYFIIALVHVINKEALFKAYKRFVSSNYKRLQKLDKAKIDLRTGKILKPGNRMFINGKFKELKGSQFDKEMKLRFIDFFSKKKHFNIFYIKFDNTRLTDTFCSNTARVFNYSLKLAIGYFIQTGLLPNEDCHLQIDERNEKTGTRYFLETYLNTELKFTNIASGQFKVTYFDSANNRLIQLADVFANLYYSYLKTGNYKDSFDQLEANGIIRRIFEFPPRP